jgi:hypothetical protein
MRIWNSRSVRMWGLYGILLGGLVYSGFALGTEPAYAYDPCNAAECAEINSGADSLCSHFGGVAAVSCPDNPPDTAIVYCNDGQQFNLICRD